MSGPRKNAHRIDYNAIDSGGKIPPQAVEFEEAVLGGILIEGSIVHKIINTLVPELFYLDQHQHICEAITDLYKEKRPIDILTVTQKLKDNEKLDIVGGPFKLANLTARVSSTANIEYQISILQQKALKRKLIILASKAIQDGFSDSEDVFSSLQSLQLALDTSVKEVVRYEIAKVDSINAKLIKESYFVAQHGLKSGVPSGLRMLDNVTNGWQKTDLIIIAGRPSMGKTALAVSLILNAAIGEKKPIGFFSIEMSKDQIVGRMQSNLSGLDVSRIIHKQLTEDEINQMARKCEPLEWAKIFIDDTPSLRVLEFKSKARKMVIEEGIELIVIDYLQLMKTDEKHQTREQEVATISREIKATAKELNVPIIALAQLSRAVESRGGDKKPSLHDLRDSGQIEQDADMIAFCYRPEYYKFENYEVDNQDFDSRGLFMLLVEKHRNGALGEIPMKFIHDQAKIVNHPRFEPSEEFQNYEDITYQDIPDKPAPAGSPQSIFGIGARLLEESGEMPPPKSVDDIPF